MPTLELQMIVKNGAATLARCLRSVRGIADRIIVGDTGSTDESCRIASQFGAKVIDVPWHNDFAEARNCVLAHAECDWILFLDADEMLDRHAAGQISPLLLQPGAAAYDVTTWNYVLDAGFRSSGELARRNPALLPESSGFPAYFTSSNARLFRSAPGVYFEHCVHETIADRLAALQLHRQPAAFVVHHFGYVEDVLEKRAQKETLYYELALKKVAQSPESYQANLGAGIAHLDHAKAPRAALPYFQKAATLDARRALAWLYAGISLTRLGNFGEALAHINRSLAIDAANPLTFSSLGDILLQLGDHGKSRNAYQDAIALGDASPLTLAKLGAAQVYLGDCEGGIEKVEQAISQSAAGGPAAAELYDIYAPVAFLAGKSEAACEAAERRLSFESVTAFNFLLAATLYFHANMRRKAETTLEAGAARFPNDPEIRNMMNSLERR